MYGNRLEVLLQNWSKIGRILSGKFGSISRKMQLRLKFLESWCPKGVLYINFYTVQRGVFDWLEMLSLWRYNCDAINYITIKM